MDNFLGNFNSIEEVRTTHPLGGVQGDYVTIGTENYYWNPFSLEWTTEKPAAVVPVNSVREINNLGSFSNIEEVYSKYPNGGNEGDYLFIGSVEYVWNKWERVWQNKGDTTPVGGRTANTFDGDLIVGNDLYVGGNLRVKGLPPSRETPKVLPFDDYVDNAAVAVGSPVDSGEIVWDRTKKIFLTRSDNSYYANVYDADNYGRATAYGVTPKEGVIFYHCTSGEMYTWKNGNMIPFVSTTAKKIKEIADAAKKKADENAEAIRNMVISGGLPIVQEAGTDTAKVMSQAAVAKIISQYDVSASNGGAKYVLREAIDAVPLHFRKGGIEIKFIDSKNEEYVSWQCITPEWSTDTLNWAKTGDTDLSMLNRLISGDLKIKRKDLLVGNRYETSGNGNTYKNASFTSIKPFMLKKGAIIEVKSPVVVDGIYIYSEEPKASSLIRNAVGQKIVMNIDGYVCISLKSSDVNAIISAISISEPSINELRNISDTISDSLILSTITEQKGKKYASFGDVGKAVGNDIVMSDSWKIAGGAILPNTKYTCKSSSSFSYAILDSSEIVLNKGVLNNGSDISTDEKAAKIVFTITVYGNVELYQQKIKYEELLNNSKFLVENKKSIENIISDNTATTYKLDSKGYYSNGVVGSIMNTEIQSSGSWCCRMISVKAGDVITLDKASGGSSPRAYALLDETYKILFCTEMNTSFIGDVIAKVDGYLVVNGKANTSITVKSNVDILRHKVERNFKEVSDFKSRLEKAELAQTEFNINEQDDGADNMMWTWWYYPQAITCGKQMRPLLFGYVDNTNRTGVAKYCGDFVKKRPLKYYNAKKYDDHSACAVLEMKDGRIMVVSDGNHGATNYLHVRISTKAGDIDDFGNDIAIEAATKGCSYAQALLVNDTYYIFFRDGSVIGYSHWKCVKSADGEQWSAPIDVIASDLQYYCLFRPVSDDKNIIRIVMYSNPTMGDTNIRQGFIDARDGKIYNSDGSTTLGAMGGGVNKDNFSILIAENSTQRLLDLAISEKSKPIIAFCRFAHNSAPADYFVYKDGSQHKICTSEAPFYTGSGYHNGMSFIGANKVVVSRYDSVSDSDVLEMYSLNDFSLIKELHRYNTHGKIFREIRPIVDANGLYVLTVAGYYKNNTFRDWNTECKIYEI